MTDSIAAVEAAWSRVAHEIGPDPAFVNLAHFKPHLRAHELAAGVESLNAPSFFTPMHAPAPACAVRRAISSLLSDAGSSTGSEPSSTASS
jgi:hypothetical protein